MADPQNVKLHLNFLSAIRYLENIGQGGEEPSHAQSLSAEQKRLTITRAEGFGWKNQPQLDSNSNDI